MGLRFGGHLVFHRVCDALVVRGASEKNGRAIILVPSQRRLTATGTPRVLPESRRHWDPGNGGAAPRKAERLTSHQKWTDARGSAGPPATWSAWEMVGHLGGRRAAEGSHQGCRVSIARWLFLRVTHLAPLSHVACCGQKAGLCRFPGTTGPNRWSVPRCLEGVGSPRCVLMQVL